MYDKHNYCMVHKPYNEQDDYHGHRHKSPEPHRCFHSTTTTTTSTVRFLTRVEKDEFSIPMWSNLHTTARLLLSPRHRTTPHQTLKKVFLLFLVFNDLSWNHIWSCSLLRPTATLRPILRPYKHDFSKNIIHAFNQSIWTWLSKFWCWRKFVLQLTLIHT